MHIGSVSWGSSFASQAMIVMPFLVRCGWMQCPRSPYSCNPLYGYITKKWWSRICKLHCSSVDIYSTHFSCEWEPCRFYEKVRKHTEWKHVGLCLLQWGGTNMLVGMDAGIAYIFRWTRNCLYPSGNIYMNLYNINHSFVEIHMYSCNINCSCSERS